LSESDLNALARQLSGEPRGVLESPTDDVADGEDVPHVGALLLVHRDEPALIDLHARGLGTDHLPVGLRRPRPGRCRTPPTRGLTALKYRSARFDDVRVYRLKRRGLNRDV
jgi:hypothetical protein